MDFWYKEVLKQKTPRKLTNLLNLANDVIQTGRRKGSEYVDEIVTVLEKAVIQMAICGDDKSIRHLRRILAMWEDRAVYRKDFIDRLLRSAKANLNEPKLLRIWNTRPTDTKSEKLRKSDFAQPAQIGEYSKDNDSDVIYIAFTYETDYKIAAREHEMLYVRQATYGGYKFEGYVTAPLPSGGDTCGYDVINPNERFKVAS